MKNIKKLGVISIIVAVVLAVGVVAYAATVQTPAEIASEVTGKSIDDVIAMKTDGKTYGKIADELGKLDEFKSLILEQKKAILDEKVADGSLTQEEADEIYNKLVEAQENCDGTGGNQIGKEYGVSFGMGSGKGQSQGQGNRFNQNGNSQSSGHGLRDRSCVTE